MPNKILRDTTLFLKLSRPLNIGMALLVSLQAFWMSADKTLMPFQDPLTWLLIFLVSVVMASGYWVNDLYDYRIDVINKPHRTYIPAHISTKKVWTGWFTAWILVIVAGLLYPPRIQLILQGTWILLFLYARYFKRMPVIGNLVVATLGSALVLTSAAWLYRLNFGVLCLAVFSFEATLLREITKDVEDLEGDMRYQLKTLPIMIGIRSTKNVLAWAYGIFLISCLIPIFADYYILHKINMTFIVLMLALVMFPAIRLIFILGKSEKTSDFGRMSTLLKWIMVGGMIAVAAL